MTPLTPLLMSLRASYRLTVRGGLLLPPLRFALSCSFRWRFVELFGVSAFHVISGVGVNRTLFLGGSVASGGGRVSLGFVALGGT